MEIQETIVNHLNELLQADSEAISELFNLAIPCNDILANHPRVITLEMKDKKYITILGLLNGIKGVDRNIMREKTKEGKTIAFKKANYMEEKKYENLY